MYHESSVCKWQEMNWCQDFQKIRVHQEREEEDAPLSLGFVTGHRRSLHFAIRYFFEKNLPHGEEPVTSCAFLCSRFFKYLTGHNQLRVMLATLGIPGKVVWWTFAKPACRNKGLSTSFSHITAALLIG